MKPYPSKSTVRLYMMFTSGRSLAIGMGVIALSTAALVISGCGETTAKEQKPPQSASSSFRMRPPYGRSPESILTFNEIQPGSWPTPG